MAYSTSNPPALGFQSMAAARQWVYKSTHTGTEAEADGFFTDGYYLGMKVGDPVLVIGSTTYIITSHAVTAVTTTGAGLSTGSLYSS